MSYNTYHHDKPFTLESGYTLPVYHLGYTTFGELNNAKDNVVWIFHALTANSDASEWWPGLVGKDKLFDPEKYFIICANMPGGCYGSTGPLDINPESGEPYYHTFPFFTPRDMIRAYQPLKDFLGSDVAFSMYRRRRLFEDKSRKLYSKQTFIEDFDFVQNLNLKDMNGYLNYYIAAN